MTVQAVLDHEVKAHQAVAQTLTAQGVRDLSGLIADGSLFLRS
jgi:hypothetical protein